MNESLLKEMEVLAICKLYSMDHGALVVNIFMN